MTSVVERKKMSGITGGALAGTGAGLVTSAAAVSATGTVTGLSGAGIASGLAAIGGSMVGGMAVVTCGTVVLAGLGAWAGYKRVKSTTRTRFQSRSRR